MSVSLDKKTHQRINNQLLMILLLKKNSFSSK